MGSNNKPTVWPIEHLEILRENYPVQPLAVMLKLLPYTAEQIKKRANRSKLTKRGRLKKWSFEDEQRLIALYPNMQNEQLAIELGKSFFAIKTAATHLKLRKDKSFIIKIHTANLFKGGFEPHNKGRKQTEWMSEAGIKSCEKTRYQHGQISTKDQAEGTVTIRDRSSGRRPYKYIKVGKNWISYHKYRWEREKGPIPAGYQLWCRTDDSLNCDPDNWELITRKEGRLRNADWNRLPANYVARMLSPKDEELQKQALEHPALIELKRNQLLLNRAIKQNGK